MAVIKKILSNEQIQAIISETERRQAHLKLITDTNSLKPLVLKCTQTEEKKCPSAQVLSETLYDVRML